MNEILIFLFHYICLSGDDKLTLNIKLEKKKSWIGKSMKSKCRICILNHENKIGIGIGIP